MPGVNVHFNMAYKAIRKDLPQPREAIYIGKFGDLEEKEFDALYKDGTIYATNEQDDEDDLIDDIIHELAHLAEENLGHYIYSDRKIIDEFLGKRERLYSILKAHNYEPPGREAFYDLEYNKKFDYFLYKTIGYQKLTYLLHVIHQKN